MKNWTLRAARSYVIGELEAAEHSELQALRHLRNAGEEWINIKEELGERGLNISDWCKAHMPVSRQWLDRHAELAKGWRKFLSARKWANDVGYTSRRKSGLDYALELMAAKQRSDTISSASRLAQDPVAERLSPGVTALSRVRILTGDAFPALIAVPISPASGKCRGTGIGMCGCSFIVAARTIAIKSVSVRDFSSADAERKRHDVRRHDILRNLSSITAAIAASCSITTQSSRVAWRLRQSYQSPQTDRGCDRREDR